MLIAQILLALVMGVIIGVMATFLYVYFEGKRLAESKADELGELVDILHELGEKSGKNATIIKLSKDKKTDESKRPPRSDK